MNTRLTCPRRSRAGALVAVLASLAVLTAACTGTSGGDAASAAPGTADVVTSSQGAGPGSSTEQTPAASTEQTPTASVGQASDASATDVPAADSADPTGSTAQPPATTPVAPPTTGGIDQTVADVSQASLPPASFQQPVTVDTQVTATVDGVQQVDATGRGVGEISGPALAYTVTVANTGSGAIDLAGVSVNVQDQSGAPLSSIDGDPAKPLTGSLEPGQSAQGTYVFTLPTDFSGPTTLSLAYAAGAPIALFTGVAS